MTPDAARAGGGSPPEPEPVRSRPAAPPDPDDAHALPLAWRSIPVDGRDTHYGEVGEGAPVVFLHGWALSNRSYAGALERLVGQGVRVVAPSMPGFGATPALPEAEHSLEGFARWVTRFLDALDIDEPAVVIGHSFGGGVAIRVACDHPARVRGLVLVNSIGGSAWSRRGGAVRSMAERPLWDWGLHFSRDLLPLQQVTRVLPVVARDAFSNVVRNPRAVWRAAGLAKSADLTDELESLRAGGLPIVVLWGDQDRIIPEASTGALLTALGDPESITVPGNHSWLIADPDAFGEVMTNVLPLAVRARQREQAEGRAPAPAGSPRRGAPRRTTPDGSRPVSDRTRRGRRGSRSS